MKHLCPAYSRHLQMVALVVSIILNMNKLSLREGLVPEATQLVSEKDEIWAHVCLALELTFLYCTRSMAKKKRLHLFNNTTYFISSSPNVCKEWLPALGSSCWPFLATTRKVKHSALCLDVKFLFCSGNYSWWHLQMTREEGWMCLFFPRKMAMNFMIGVLATI